MSKAVIAYAKQRNLGVHLSMSGKSELIFQLTYHSKSKICPHDAKEAISNILRVAQKRNRENGVTGALILHQDRFAQIIEGAQESVEALFDEILNDTRHKEIKVYRQSAQVPRIFGDWHMALIGEDEEADIPLFATKNAIAISAEVQLSDSQRKATQILRELVTH